MSLQHWLVKNFSHLREVFFSSSGLLGKILFLSTISYTASYWFGSLKVVDPLHHTVSFYTGNGWWVVLLFLIFASLAGVLLFCLKGRVTQGGLLFALLAALFTCFPSFAALAGSLFLLSAAVWMGMETTQPEFTEKKFYIAVPIALFVYTFAVGVEQQIKAYNSLILLYNDWGIYFSEYLKLAERPLDSLCRLFSTGNHFNPSVNVLMSFIVGFFPHAYTIFTVNSFVIASAAPLVFMLGRSLKLPGALCTACAAAAAFNMLLSNQHTTLTYGYHPIIFLLPAALLFCIAKEHKCLTAMILLGIFMCGIKETVFVFLFGIVFLSALKKKWYQAAALGAGLIIVFMVITHWILPYCDGKGSYFQLFQYKSLGGSTKDVLLSPLVVPGVFWGKFFNSGTLAFVLLLLLPVFPAVLGAPRFLLAALPVLLGVILKDCYLNKHNIVQWYGVEITVWLLIGMVYGMAELYKAKKVSAGLLAGLLFGCLAGYYFVGKTPLWGTYSAEAVRRSPDVRVVRENLKKLLPKDAVLALSQKWGAQLVESHRNLKINIAEPDTDFRILDFTDSSCSMEEMMRVRDRLLKENTEHPVGFYFMRGCQVIVFRKGKGPWKMPFINQVPARLLQQAKPIPLNDPGIRARGILFPAQRKMLVFLKPLPGYDRDCAVTVTLFWNKLPHKFQLRWGYGLFPAYMMKEDQYFIADLPLPRNWAGLDAVQINIDSFESPKQGSSAGKQEIF